MHTGVVVSFLKALRLRLEDRFHRSQARESGGGGGGGSAGLHALVGDEGSAANVPAGSGGDIRARASASAQRRDRSDADGGRAPLLASGARGVEGGTLAGILPGSSHEWRQNMARGLAVVVILALEDGLMVSARLVDLSDELCHGLHQSVASTAVLSWRRGRKRAQARVCVCHVTRSGHRRVARLQDSCLVRIGCACNRCTRIRHMLAVMYALGDGVTRTYMFHGITFVRECSVAADRHDVQRGTFRRRMHWRGPRDCFVWS